MIEQLLALSINDIESGQLPLRDLLVDSLYYPACDIDGGVVKYCNEHFDEMEICSYVYADYATGEDRLEEYLDGFRGYSLLAARTLRPSDIGADKPLMKPDGIDPKEYLRYRQNWRHFAKWTVFERDPEFGKEHGPQRFSLLYLGAEGAAAYSGLYLANKITPKAMAVIQPGTGFGLNWTDFTNPEAPLAKTVMMSDVMPEYFFYGGHGDSSYKDFAWPGYNMIGMITNYYPKAEGSVTIWRHDIL